MGRARKWDCCAWKAKTTSYKTVTSCTSASTCNRCVVFDRLSGIAELDIYGDARILSLAPCPARRQVVRQSKRRCERLGALRTHGHLPSKFKEEELRAAKEKLKQTVTADGGKLGEIKEMGKRRLAYEINNLPREGIYQVCQL